MSELAKRAVACPGWRWLPGMLVTAIVEGDKGWYRLDGADELYKESWILCHESRIYDDTDDVTDVLPDLADPCTLGGLLALVREVWVDEWLHTGPQVARGQRFTDVRVWVVFGADCRGCDGATEAEALVAALEAAS